ncbi:MAG: YraN family protein [Hyphomicrobiales bacterium]|nr:YraN family protein [Hyphomicrobiales bacterium]
MTASKHKRRMAYAKGCESEALAAKMLERQGYRILNRRFRSPAGEIDLIALNGRHLAFIEVKARRRLADAAYSVTERQQRRIADAAGYWLQSFPDHIDKDMSFDAVLIGSHGQSEHIRDAFRLC